MADAKKDDKKQRSDPIIEAIGDLGRYQVLICLFVFLSKFPTGWVTLATVFFAAPMDEKCIKPENVTDECSSECTEIYYDHSVFEETVVSEFGLICDKEYLASLSQTLVMFGILWGSIIFGSVSDRYGRRPAFLICCMVNLVTGIAVSFSPWLWFFMLFQFMDAIAVGGIMVTSFVIIMEIVGKSKRELMAVLYQIPFNVGHASLALFAYFLRHWRWYNFGFSICSSVFLLYICFLPESPRWLFTQGRLEEASDILEKIARRNGKPTEKIRADLQNAHKVLTQSEPIKRGKMSDLLRYPNLRKNTMVMAFDWLAICFVYYGCAQYLSKLTGNIFMNVFISAILGVPGTCICVPLTKYMGRKITLILSNSISAIGLLGVAFTPSVYGTTQVVLASVGLFGASVTFPNVYLYGGELFPTVVRNSGVGLCSMFGRVGSMAAPFVIQLKNIAFWLPPLVMGCIAAMAALLTFLLPETKGTVLPETIEDGEQFGKKSKASAE